MSNNMKMGKCGYISSNIWVVKGDTRSQIVTISVPRMEGGVDLSNLAWYIKIENAAKVTDICRPEAGSIVISEDTIAFDWLICGIATAFVGTTHFAVEGVDETVDGHPIVWRSAPGAIYVGENLDAEISSESEADLSNLQKLIVYVNGELDNVIAAGKAAVESANAAASTNQNIKDAEFKRVSAENARVEAENARLTAETLRQSAFEANEANRNTAFESAENARESEWTEIKSDVESSVGTAVASASAATDAANTAAENANAAAEKSVRYDVVQALTDAHKERARENIAAASAEDVGRINSDLDVLKTFTYGKHAYGENIVMVKTVPAGTTLNANSFAVQFTRQSIGVSRSMIVLDCIGYIKAEFEANETDYDNINKNLFFQCANKPWGKGTYVYNAISGTPYWFYDTRRESMQGYDGENLPGYGNGLIKIRTQQGTYTTTGDVTITYTALRLYANGI